MGWSYHSYSNNSLEYSYTFLHTFEVNISVEICVCNRDHIYIAPSGVQKERIQVSDFFLCQFLNIHTLYSHYVPLKTWNIIVIPLLVTAQAFFHSVFHVVFYWYASFSKGFHKIISLKIVLNLRCSSNVPEIFTWAWFSFIIAQSCVNRDVIEQ